MEKIVYVNGDFVKEREAKISVFDRGFLFADGVYEVCSVLDGRLIDNANHLKRLRRSLRELAMPSPASDAEIEAIQNALITQNALEEGCIYLQITRGAADRDFAYPKKSTPSLMLFTQQKNLLHPPQAKTGITVITVPDIRWARRDIKTIGLLAPSMAKQTALNHGADDAWFIENGLVTEGSSNNAFIVTQDDVIRTRQASHAILNGITRTAILALCRQHHYQFEERSFSLEEALEAKEAFISSATTFIWPVIAIDNTPINDGKLGPVAQKLRALYIDHARQKFPTEKTP